MTRRGKEAESKDTHNLFVISQIKPCANALGNAMGKSLWIEFMGMRGHNGSADDIDDQR